MRFLRTQRSIQQRLPPKRTAQQPPSSSNVILRNAKEFTGSRRQNEHRATSSKGPPPQWKACFRCYFAFLLRWADLACPARSLTTLLRPTREASRYVDVIYAGPTSSSHSNTTATPSIRTQASFTLIQAEDRLWRRQGFMLSPSQKTRFSTEANCLTLQQ